VHSSQHGAIAISTQQSVRLFFDGGAAAFEGEHLGGEIRDARGGVFDAEAARVDVGDEIAVGVGLAGAGSVGHVGGKAFGGGEAGAFPDQEDDHAGREKVADGVHDADTGVAHNEGLAHGPTTISKLLLEQREQNWHLRGDCGAGEAVANHNLDIWRFWAALSDQGFCVFGESAAQVRAEQELRFRFRVAGNLKEIQVRHELRREIFLKVEFHPYRVHGAGMRAPKIECHWRGVGGASLDKNTGGSTFADFPDNLRPGGRGGKFVFVVHGSNQMTATEKTFQSATSANTAAMRINNPATLASSRPRMHDRESGDDYVCR